MRVYLQSTLTALLVLGWSSALGAQSLAINGEVRTLPSQEGRATEALLSRQAHLSIEKATLFVALSELQRGSGVPLAFSPTLLPEKPRVSCACDELSVGEALDRILDGVAFRYVQLDHQVLVEPYQGPHAVPSELTPQTTLRSSLVSNTSLVAPLQRTNSVRDGEIRRTGTIQGEVVDSRTQRPIAGAQVQIPGTNLGMTTNNLGRFQLMNVPAGETVVRVQMIGYAPSTQTVTVGDGAVVSVTFQLTEQVIALDELVVTGTAGGTQRRAIGNVVESLNADELMAKSPVGNVDQLLAQRSPGVMMLPGTGQVGTGSAIRIRGNSSLTLANEPIIYIDGVRMDSNPRRGPSQRGGANVSRLNDINPSDIESIEIIKGPAAATLYGTEASNGVVQIITKRGSSGAPQFNVSSSLGTNWLWNPEGRTGMRYMPDPNNPDELIGFNVYEHERVNGNGPIFGYGLLQSYNVNVRGGTDAVRYYASISRDDDRGIVSWNWNNRLAVRGNLEMNLSDKWNVRFGSAYIQGGTRLAQGSIDTDPFSNLIWSNPRGMNTPTRGWRAAPPEEWGKVESRMDNDRTTTNVEVRFQPVNWMTHRLVAGLDLNAEASWTLYPQQPEGANHFYGNLGLGSKSVSRGNRKYLTLDYAGSAEINWNEYTFTPSVGFQYYRSQSSFINSSGAEFPALPITTVSGGAVRNGGESFSENATAGVYFQQQVGWRNRVFVTGAVRADANSAFGSEFNAAIYPKFSATWSVHEESFWSLDFMDQFRLRMAWGAAGQQPGTIDATRLYGPQIGYRDQPALSPSAYGNPHLKPERGEELELGFDASFLDGRLALEFTRYQRAVKDAIVGRPLAPSSGFTGSQIVNIGLLNAWGNEFGINARLLERPRFQWDLDTQYSTMANEIKDLGGLGYISGGTQSQHREGYSIGDLFMRRIVSAEIDAQGAVLSAMCDGGSGPEGVDPGGALVPCADAPQVLLGHSQPTWQIGVGNTFTLFDNLSFYVRVEGNGGHKQVNTEIRATHNQSTTEAVLRGDNPILQATRIYENDRTGVYDAGFLRLREVSANYTLPNRLAGTIGAKSGSVSLGMRNIAMLWTAQHGWNTPRDGSVRESIANMITWDPEVRATGQAAVDYQTVLPPAASATLTIRLGF